MEFEPGGVTVSQLLVRPEYRRTKWVRTLKHLYSGCRMRHFLNQVHSVLARTASLTTPPQSHKLHDFIHVHDKKDDYT